MVTIEKIDNAIAEAERFILKAKECKRKLKNDRHARSMGCRETGNVRRASLDLSNSLVDLRT